MLRATRPGLEHLPIEVTAEAVREAGGIALALACDHTDPGQVRALIRRVAQDYGRLGLLVNNAWGGHDLTAEISHGTEVWDESPELLRNMLLGGAYGNSLTSLCALRELVGPAGRGMIVCTTCHTDELPGWLPYEVSKVAKNRFGYALSDKLRSCGSPMIGVAPGWMRLELMERAHPAGELAELYGVIDPDGTQPQWYHAHRVGWS